MQIENIINGNMKLYHHAILFLNRAFAVDGLPVEFIVNLAKEYCGINIPSMANDDLWTSLKRHPDVTIVDRERAILRREEFDELKETINISASVGKKRLVVIDKCSRMNTSAANSLLKVLEEPLIPVLFVLSASNLKEVLNTVSSRCQKINLSIKGFTSVRALKLMEPADVEFLEHWFKPSYHIPEKIDSLVNKTVYSYSAEAISEASLVSAEFSKKYSASLIQDGIVEILGEKWKREPQFAPFYKSLIGDVMEWRRVREMNPSTALWLMQVLIKASFIKGK